MGGSHAWPIAGFVGVVVLAVVIVMLVARGRERESAERPRGLLAAAIVAEVGLVGLLAWQALSLTT